MRQAAPRFTSAGTSICPGALSEPTSLLLQAGDHLTIGDLAPIQLDTQTTIGQSLATDLIGALQRAGLPANDPDAASSIAALRTWDGNASAKSIGATIYETLVAVLDRDLVQQTLGPGSYSAYTLGVFETTQLQALQGILKAPQVPFFGATSNLHAGAACDQAVQAALGESDALLRSTLGTNTSTWTWGALHTLTYNHPLASADPRLRVLSFPAGGDGETVDTGGWFMEMSLLALPADQLYQAGGAQAAFQQDALANAQVVNMGNVDGSLEVLSTGESGDPTSPHWADQAALWRAGKYNCLAFSSLAAQQTTGNKILLH